MPHVRTRKQLLDRFVRETNNESLDEEKIRYFLAEAWDIIWAMLVRSDATGVGEKFYTEVVAADSDTWTPPSDFRTLVSLSVRPSASSRPGAPLTRTTHREAEREGYDLLTGSPLYYLISGPTSDGTPTPTPSPAVIQFFPGLRTGQVIRIVYTTPAPSLGNPTVPTDDTAAIDLDSPEVERALIDLARVRASSRDDDKERIIAASAITDSLEAALNAQFGRDKFSSVTLDSYRSSTVWRGY